MFVPDRINLDTSPVENRIDFRKRQSLKSIFGNWPTTRNAESHFQSWSTRESREGNIHQKSCKNTIIETTHNNMSLIKAIQVIEYFTQLNKYFRSVKIVRNTMFDTVSARLRHFHKGRIWDYRPGWSLFEEFRSTIRDSGEISGNKKVSMKLS
jgi:hypothetical protein